MKPENAPTRMTILPTERSMLPPVRMHMSMPVANMTTYPFCLIRFVRFAGCKSEPLPKNSGVEFFIAISTSKNSSTNTKTTSMAFLLKNFVTLFILYYAPLLDCRIAAMITS